MTTTRTHFTFRVDTWTPDGESIVEHVVGVEDYQVAQRRRSQASTRSPLTSRWPDFASLLHTRSFQTVHMCTLYLPFGVLFTSLPSRPLRSRFEC